MANVNNDIIQKLQTAHQTKEPIDFIHHYYTVDEPTAYTIQEQFVKEKCEHTDEAISGYKISMTSPETQKLADTDEPAYGTFTEGNLVKTKRSVSLETLFDPLIEPELVFILTDDLSMGAAEQEILAKSKIAAGLEVPDSRYKDWFPNFSLEDLLCDNGAVGLVVIADAVEPPSIDELNDIQMELFHNGKKTGEGTSANVLGNPASAVAWLTRKLEGHGKTLNKGMIIASGTFISPLRAEKGTYTAAYTGIGEVSLTFTR